MAVFMKDGVTMAVTSNGQVAAFRKAGWKEIAAQSAPKEEKEAEVDISTITPDNIDALEWGQMKTAARLMGINTKGMGKDEIKAAMLEKLAVKEAQDG